MSGLDKGATLLADRGRIEVKQVSGPVVSDLRKGEQEFVELLGGLEARGIEGAMRLQSVRGRDLRADLVRGRIVGDAIKVDTMAVQSVFGDIELVVEPVFDGRYRVASRKGNVEVRFHGATPVALDVYASKAMIGKELAASRATEGGPWKARFNVQSTATKVRPAQLEIRAAAGQVLVKHF